MKTVSAIPQLVSHLSDDHVAIYLFHGVIEKQRHEVRNYTRKHLELEHFLKLLKALKVNGSCISMEMLACARTKGDLPRRPFVITFDDGFENNLTVAVPALKELGMAATFYVTTGFVDKNAMSWIDRIEHCVEYTPRAEVRVPWRVKPSRFFDAASKIAFLKDLRVHVKSDPKLDVECLICSIHRECGKQLVSESNDPLDQKLSWEQVRELASDRDFIVGGHSHSHSILSFLSEDALHAEIAESLSLLEDKAGVGADHYSYPEGLAHCYSPLVIDVLKSHGVRCCPTAIGGVNRAGDDLFHLKRIMVV